MLVRGRPGKHQPATVKAGRARLPDVDPAAGARHDAETVVPAGDLARAPARVWYGDQHKSSYDRG